MNWDDLHIMLAVARQGTLHGAAEALGVNATTVSRRLKALEQSTGARLFEKLKHGAVLTDAGDDMAQVAAHIDQLVHALDARLQGRDAKLEGTLRATFTDLALLHWLRDLASFKEAHPHIDLEVTSTVAVQNLTQREADVAVRVAASAPEHLIGSRWGDIHMAAFAATDVVAASAPNAGPSDYAWIAWDKSLGPVTDVFLQKNAPHAEVVMRLSQLSAILQATVDGLGATLLPCLMGDAHPGLRRVTAPFSTGASLWVLTHPELRRSARVRAFTAFMRGLIQRDLDLIEGRRPQPTTTTTASSAAN